MQYVRVCHVSCVSMLVLALVDCQLVRMRHKNVVVLPEWQGGQGVMSCNTSKTQLSPPVEEPIYVKAPGLENSEIQHRPYFCVYEFKAPEGHYVEADVLAVATGAQPYNFTAKGCGGDNYLRIHDGLGRSPVWKPSEFCGDFPENSINVKRIVSGREMKIEFKVQNFTERTGYDVEVRFKKFDVMQVELKNKFGGYGDVGGRVQRKVCEWEIKVNECIGLCELTSPGFPGVYPPLVTCGYKLINEEGDRVELHLSGTSTDPGKFDLKKSENCKEDRLVVYDGDGIASPIIAILCGETELDPIFSSGSTLYLELRTFAGLSPWHYSGFDARLGHRYSDMLKTGMKMGNNKCNWMFNSTIDKSGYLRTPDTYIHAEEECMCQYYFYGRPGEIVSFKIIVHALRPEEYVNIYEKEASEPMTISSENVAVSSRRTVRSYNSTTNQPVVHYQLSGGQLSNQHPVEIQYRFIEGHIKVMSNEERDAIVVSNGKSSSPVSFFEKVVLAALTIALRIAYDLQMSFNPPSIDSSNLESITS